MPAHSAISYCLSNANECVYRHREALMLFDSIRFPGSIKRARRKHRHFVGTEVLLLLRVLTDSLPERETLLTFPRRTRETYITLRCATRILLSCLFFSSLFFSHVLLARDTVFCRPFFALACLQSVELIDHSSMLLSHA